MSGSILINYSFCTYQEVTTQLLVCFPIKYYLDFISIDILRDSEKCRGKKICITMNKSLKPSVNEQVPEYVKNEFEIKKGSIVCLKKKCFHLPYCI